MRVRACFGEVHGGGVAHRAEQPPHAPLQRETGSFLRRSCAATGQGTQRSLISAAKLWFDIHSARELWKPTCPCGSAAPSLFPSLVAGCKWHHHHSTPSLLLPSPQSLFPSLVAGCKVRTFSRGPAGFCARARQVWVEAFADAGVQSRLWRQSASALGWCRRVLAVEWLEHSPDVCTSCASSGG